MGGESQKDRWILWLPVVLGSGIAVYFALPEEPSRLAGPLVVLSAAAVALAWRRQMAGWLPALAVMVAALGFTLAAERTHRVAAPVLHRAGVIALTGRIAEVQPEDYGERLVLDRLDAAPLRDGAALPERIRLRLPQGVGGFQAGQRLSLRAYLAPPSPPTAPGAYDFPRQAWFLGIGGVGSAILPIAILPPTAAEGEGRNSMVERLRLRVAVLRHALTERIVNAAEAAGLPAGSGATAAALITGERGPVPPAVLQAYRDAGLAHILVIAGMHMSMVAGLVFVGLRGLLAAIPPLALRWPIKKITAAASLLVALAYLVISGAPVPTQRAFIMNALVLTAILFDREALSLRSITWAALLILALQPEALIGASFQMSFAAVYALISGYEALAPWLTAWRRWRGWWWDPLFHIFGILLTTQIAGSATAFYTAYHFNRYAVYSLLGNALAVPLVGFWVMPAALLALVLLPFGLDGVGWRLMGWGISLVTRIAETVSALPGAAIDLPAVPMPALLVFTLGGFWLLLWRRRRRLWGLAGLALGLGLWALSPSPDLLIGTSGRMLALRAADGRLAFLGEGRASRRERQSWAQRDGQGGDPDRWPDAEELAADHPERLALRCDSLGCGWRVKGHRVALLRWPDALEEDCRTADLVVVAVPARLRCPAARRLIDAGALRAGGTHAVWLEEDGGLRVESVADWQGNRPWSPRRRTATAPSPSNSGDAETEERTNSGAAIPPDVPEP